MHISGFTERDVKVKMGHIGNYTTTNIGNYTTTNNLLGKNMGKLLLTSMTLSFYLSMS